MSAVPLSVPDSSLIQWSEVSDELVLEKIIRHAREGLLVLAAETACFDASIHALFSQSLVVLPALLEANSVDDTKLAVKQPRYPLVVLDCMSIESVDIDYILGILPAHVPVALLHSAGARPEISLFSTNVVLLLANDGSAGENWSAFQSSRVRNNERLVVLDFIDYERAAVIQALLTARNFQVVMATERIATTFVQNPAGSQILVLEASPTSDEVADYIRRLRMSHETDAVGIVVTGDLQDENARCELLEAGADELLYQSSSQRELLIRLFALGRQQNRSRQIRHDAYRFPGSVAYNADYLVNVGNKLYASAQRDVITMALAVIRLVFVETESSAQVSGEQRAELVQSIAHYCGKNLRETDLFAQAGEREFIALVTCVGRNNIARVFNRLSDEVGQLVERSSDGKIAVRLDTGVTCDLGVSFSSMLERAQQALEKSVRCPERTLIVN